MTSTTIGLSDTYDNNSDDMVAYCFASVDGYSKIGTYRGNGSADGPFVQTGFKPRWVLIKRTDGTSHWQMLDTKRSPTNPMNAGLNANLVGHEGSGTSVSSFSNGFKLKAAGEYNTSNAEYVYLSFAEYPVGRGIPIELEMSTNTDIKKFIPGDIVSEYTTNGSGGYISSNDAANNKITVMSTDGVDSFTTDGTVTLTKPVTPPSSQRWTWAAWVKRGDIGSGQVLFSNSNADKIQFTTDDQLEITNSDNSVRITSNAVFADPSTWNHIVVSVDYSTVTLYVNGESISDLKYDTPPSVDYLWSFNANDVKQTISPAAGYLADVQFVDGQALEPSDFIAVSDSDPDPREGQLQPKKMEEWFGTRGYHLSMADPNDIGIDISGNSDDWTLGATSDYSSTSTVDNAATMFDGDVNTYATSAFNTNGYQTVLETLVIINSTFTYTANNYGNSGTRSLRLTRLSDGATTTVTGTAANGNPWSIPAAYKGVLLSKIEWERTMGSYENVSRVQIDGVTLVDGTPITDSSPEPNVDTPNNYGEDNGLGEEMRGNYATLNTLAVTRTNGPTYSNGNLKSTATANVWDATPATIGVSSGKWYWEGEFTQSASTNWQPIGVINSKYTLTTVPGNPGSWFYTQTGIKTSEQFGGPGVAYGATYTTGDVIGVALDMDAGTLTFYKNGVSQGQAFSDVSGTIFPAVVGYGSGSSWDMNFGQTPFQYPAPVGYKTLNTTNIETGLVPVASEQFDIITYTGNSSTQTISGMQFSPDLVWIKQRTTPTESYRMFDTLRGATNYLASDDSGVETTLANSLTAFNSDGFTLGSEGSVNYNNREYVAWCWNAGTAAPVLNTTGGQTTTVKANVQAGFSICTWSYNSGGAKSFGHGLGVEPALVILKGRPNGGSWRVWHKDFPTKNIWLDLPDPITTNTHMISGVTSSVVNFSGNGSNNTGALGNVAYCWAEVEGYSKIGKFRGNSIADGPWVYTGFRPRWVLLKTADSSNSWRIYDTERHPDNTNDMFLEPDTTAFETEVSSQTRIDVNDNGFKIKGNNASINDSASDIIFMAFAEAPTQFLPQ